ncbi:tolloid-like protein 1 [Nematostella vectensis]|nr:tolloid-like protein 1 [Nematostella vectensis]
MLSLKCLSVVLVLFLYIDRSECDGFSCREAVEGDIVVKLLLPHQGRRRVSRAAIANKEGLWKNGTVPYIIGPFFTDAVRGRILNAMRNWEKQTCLRFVPRTDQRDYIEIRLKPGCCSAVGRVGGRQEVFLGYGCHGFGTILHELGHVIGFWHEQMRPDRDDYVEVLHQNIVEGEKHNFAKLPVSSVNSLDQIFDYQSIMLYGTNDFSSNYGRTLKAKLSRFVWKQQGGIDYFQLHTREGASQLSRRDIIQTNLLYKCALSHENGEILVESRGRLMSPNFPRPYPRSRDLSWTILPRRMRSNDVLALVFEFFLVGTAKPDGECENGDYLEIREGKGELAPYLVKLCGARKPFVIAVPRDSLYVRLHATNDTVAIVTPSPTLSIQSRRILRNSEEKRIGFLLDYRITSSCYIMLSDLNGTISSPGYPTPYPDNTDCIWQISVPTGHRIALAFIDFDFRQVNQEDGCTDYLEMREGEKATSQLVSVHCGRDFPQNLTTSGNHLRIATHSGQAGRKGGAGFKARYQAVDIDECKEGGSSPCEQGCLNVPGGYLCGCYEGYFSLRDNPHHVNCIDIDECERDNGGCSHNCTNTYGDYFCSCPQGYYLDKDQRTCKDSDECRLSICSHTCINTPGSYRCECKYGYLLDTNERSCILAIPMCTGTLTSPVGRFKSPAIPTWYRGLVECEWVIRVRELYTIGAYMSLSWSRDQDCRNYLRVAWDEGVIKESLQFCGREDIEGLGLLHFKAHEIRVHYSVQAPYPEGFTFRYHMRPKREDLCGGILYGPKGIIQSPNYPSSYPSRVGCLWQILSPKGKHVKLTFETFELESEAHCQYDYVDIRAKYQISDKLRPVGRFCGNARPPAMEPKEDEIWINFQSDSTVQRKGFRAQYTFV